MTQVDLNTEEARLVAVHRAIKELDQTDLISADDASIACVLLGNFFNDEKIEKLDSDSVKALILGFVAGLAATRVQDEPDYQWVPAEQGETQFIGGPTGGVAVGQGEDPRFITQTGAKEATKE